MRASRKKIVSLMFAVLISWGCQEIIDIDIPQTDPKLVIEGRLINELSVQKIKISESLNYYDTTDLKPLDDATVSLLDANSVLIEDFTYNSEDSFYLSNNPIELLEGNDYKVQIEVNGELFEASGSILENATLDSLYYFSAEELESLGQAAFGDGYFLFADGRLNNEGVEYFKLDVTINDTLQNSRGDFSNSVLSSELFGKQFQSLPIPGAFEEEDSVILELYTLNEDMYQYYVEFINLLFNDGGVFSPPPVNPTTNIKNLSNPENQPLGFIQFSAVQRKSIVIEKRE
jgi:hypothetical protein